MVFQKLNYDGSSSIYRQIKAGYVADFSAHLVKRNSYYGLFLRAVQFVCKAVRLNHRFEILDASKRLRHAIANILPSELSLLDAAKKKALEHSLKAELTATAKTFQAANHWFVKYLFGNSVKESELDYTYDSITRLVREKAIGGKDRAKYNPQIAREIFKRLLALDAEKVKKHHFPLSYIEKMLQKAFLGLDYIAKGIDWRWHEAQTPLVCFRYTHVNPGCLDKLGIQTEISPFAFCALITYFKKASNLNLQMTRCHLNSSHCQSLKSYLAEVNKNNGLVLSLSENEIDDAGVEAIVEGVLANPNHDFYVSILDLSKNPKITARSAASIARLVASGKLRHLLLGGCSIDAIGKKRILEAQSDPASKLRKIELTCPDAVPAHFNAPLFRAAQNADMEWIKALLDAKVDIDEKNGENKWTALHAASVSGQAEVVKLLLERNANLSTKDKLGCTPLDLAAQHGQVKCVDALLNAKADIDEKNDENEWTALHTASATGQAEVVQLLIKRKANVHAKTKDGFTPLFIAAQNGCVKCVEALLNAKADIDEKNGEDDMTALQAATYSGHYEVVQLLINRKANVRAITKDGFTALFLGAQNGHNKCVEALLNAKALINQKNGDDEWTALHIAVCKGKDDVVQQLADCKADLHALSKDHKSPLDIAADNEDYKMFDLLLRSGADSTKMRDTQNAQYKDL